MSLVQSHTMFHVEPLAIMFYLKLTHSESAEKDPHSSYLGPGHRNLM